MEPGHGPSLLGWPPLPSDRQSKTKVNGSPRSTGKRVYKAEACYLRRGLPLRPSRVPTGPPSAAPETARPHARKGVFAALAGGKVFTALLVHVGTPPGPSMPRKAVARSGTPSGAPRRRARLLLPLLKFRFIVLKPVWVIAQQLQMQHEHMDEVWVCFSASLLRSVPTPGAPNCCALASSECRGI